MPSLFLVAFLPIFGYFWVCGVFLSCRGPRCSEFLPEIGDRKGTTKKLCDEDFAERSGELSGAICLKALVLLGNDR